MIGCGGVVAACVGHTICLLTEIVGEGGGYAEVSKYGVLYRAKLRFGFWVDGVA